MLEQNAYATFELEWKDRAMSAEEGNASLDPGFFDGRFLIEIVTWDWGLHLRMSDEGFPKEYRFQGGLHYGQWFEIEGRIAAPKNNRDQRIRVWLSPFGPEMEFDVDSPDGLGHVYRHDPPKYGSHMSAQLLLPESAIPSVATCLSSVWKYIHLWTFDDDGKQASIRSYSFSRDFHPNLERWVSET